MYVGASGWEISAADLELATYIPTYSHPGRCIEPAASQMYVEIRGWVVADGRRGSRLVRRRRRRRAQGSSPPTRGLSNRLWVIKQWCRRNLQRRARPAQIMIPSRGASCQILFFPPKEALRSRLACHKSNFRGRGVSSLHLEGTQTLWCPNSITGSNLFPR